MISILSPVFKDIVIEEKSRAVSKNTVIYFDSKVEYGGVIKLQKNFRRKLDVAWYYVTSSGRIMLAENLKIAPKNSSEVTAIIYLNKDSKKTHIINMPALSQNWSGPKSSSHLLHVMYAEYFNEFNFLKLRNKYKVITVDFCGLDHIFTPQKLTRFASAFDYIFCSEHDEWANTVKKLKKISLDAYSTSKRQVTFIYHTPKYVRVCAQGEVTEIRNEYFRSAGVGKVVGNGDLFAFLLLGKIREDLTFNELVNYVKTVQRDFLNYA